MKQREDQSQAVGGLWMLPKAGQIAEDRDCKTGIWLGSHSGLGNKDKTVIFSLPESSEWVSCL